MAQIQRKLAGMANPDHKPHSSTAWSPNADVYESADDVVVKMELAGVPADSIQILLENRVLLVAGLRRDPHSGESAAGYRFRQMEIEYGPFRRVIEMPFAVDGEQTRARMQNGILFIRLPRARGSSGQKICVKMESEP